MQDREDIRQEMAFNHAAMEDSIAFVEARRGRVGEAAAAVLRADEHASILTGECREEHDTQVLIVMGMLAFQRRDYDTARGFLQSAQTLAVGRGRRGQARVLAELLTQVDERSPMSDSGPPEIPSASAASGDV